MTDLNDASNLPSSLMVKYTPTQISDMICNPKSINTICDWLESFRANKQKELANKILIEEAKEKKKKGKKGKKKAVSVESLNDDNIDENTDENIDDSDKKKKKKGPSPCLLITGNHGIGKTTAVKVILNHYKYTVRTLNFETLKITKNLDTYMDKIFHTTNVINILKKEKHENIVIVVDDLESLLSSNEKSIITALHKLNDEKWYCPIIFISNGKHSKMLSTLKKSVMTVKFYEPYPSQMKKIMDGIIKKEHIVASYDLSYKIVEYVQSDVRMLLTFLEDFRQSGKGSVITQKFFTDYINTYQKKDANIELHKGAQKLIYEYKGINECLKYYETEKVLLPLMLHLHYINCVINDCEDIKKLYNTMDVISNLISFSDVMENFIYSDQNWTIHELHGIYSCGIISYYLHELDVINITSQQLFFPLDLNKTSIRQINKKNIINSDKYFINMNVFDYIYVAKILSNMNETNNLYSLQHFLKSYNIIVDNIESVFKIDKIKKYKGSISAKKKKNMDKIMINNVSNMRSKITHTKNRKNYYSFIKIRESMMRDFNVKK